MSTHEHRLKGSELEWPLCDVLCVRVLIFSGLTVINYRVEIGDGNRIGRSAVIGIACQDLKYEKERGPTQVGNGGYDNKENKL